MRQERVKKGRWRRRRHRPRNGKRCQKRKGCNQSLAKAGSSVDTAEATEEASTRQRHEEKDKERAAREASRKAQCLGRSKGGLSCKIHAVCDAKGRPIALMLTPGQASDLHGFDGLADKIKAEVRLADKGYDADKRVREVLSKAGKTAVIPPRRNRKHPATYDKEMYKKRHKIENFFSRLKDFRAIATRYDKTKRNFLAGVQLAAAILWMP